MLNKMRKQWGIPCLLCALLFVAMGCSDRRSEQARVAGDVFLEKDRIADARASYQSALESNPDNAYAKIGLAQCAGEEGNLEDALALYRETIALDPTLDEAYVEPVRLLVDAERLEDALALSVEYAAQSSEQGGTLRGVILTRMGRTEEAIEELTQLAASFPESEEISLNLGAALLKSGKLDEAERVFDELVESGSPMSIAAHMGLVDVYRAQGRVDELVEQFSTLAEARPEDMGIKLGYARSLLLAERMDEAEALAREILENDPASGWANYIVGFQKSQAGEFEEATAFLQQAARALPEVGEIKNLLAFAESGGTAAPVEAEAPAASPGPGENVVAGPVTWSGLWKQAALNRLIAGRDGYLAEGGVPARQVLTLSALFTFNAPLAQELAAALPEGDPVRGYVDAFFSKDAAKVAAHFESWNAEERDDVLMRDNALGFAMVSGGSREQGLSAFLYCLERYPDHGVALFNISQVFRRLRQPMIAAQNLQRLIAMYPENIDAHQMHYAALREGGSFEAARRAAEASYTLFPEEKWSHIYLCQAYLDTGDPDLALQWLDRATSLFPSDPELQSILGQVLVRMGDCTQATDVLEAISTTAPAILQSKATMLAVCRVLDGDWPGAVKIAEGIPAEQRGDSLALILSAGQVQSGDTAAARAALNLGEKRPPAGGPFFGKLLGGALGDDTASMSEEERGWSERMAADPALLTSYAAVVAMLNGNLNDVAWTYYQDNLAGQDPHLALAQLAYRCLAESDSIENVGELAQGIAASMPDEPRSWLGLANIYKAEGDEAGEASAVQKALEAGPKHPEAIFRHAALMEQEGEFDKAVEDYRTLVEVAPESGAAHNNLAYTLLLAGGGDEEALKHAAIAAEKRPRDAGVLHTLGLAQMKTGNLEEAEKNMRRATEIDPANPTIMYDFGRLLAEQGLKPEAAKRVRYALAMSRNAGLDFPQAEEAAAFLDTLE